MNTETTQRHFSSSSRYTNSATVIGTLSPPGSPTEAQSTPPARTSLSSESQALSGEPYLNPKPIQGWPQLAMVMGEEPDLAAFPRFRDLNVKSLLYYQCQLINLRGKLHKLEYDDAADNKDWNEYADDLMEETESDQFKTIKEMRVVLKEYNEALLQYTQINTLPDPEPFNMRTLRKWLRNQQCGNFKVRGRDGLDCTWGDIHTNPDEGIGSLWKQFCSLLWGLLWTRTPSEGESDLALTTPKVQADGLTRWVALEFIPFRRAFVEWWNIKKANADDVEKRGTPASKKHKKVKKQRGKNRKKHETLASWSESGALRLTSTISTLVACLMPVIAISVLSQLHEQTSLLICLAGFALLFALGLIFLTQGVSKRTEVFAATAAFSAVMVVFISVPPAPVVVAPPGTPLA